MDIKIHSYDVFDTVVTRITADPVGVFYKLKKNIIVENLYLPNVLANNYVNERIAAERVERKYCNSEEITIYGIYNRIGNKFNLSSDVINELVELEIDTEIESARCISVNAQHICELKKEGQRVIFVTDMYLPRYVIKAILDKIGIYVEDDEVYVSSEHGLRKSTGNLYRDVLTREQCDPREMQHTGDNWRSDYLMARRVGKISARHYSDSKLTPYERILREATRTDEKLGSQLLAGASRLARLEHHDDMDARQRALHAVGANIAGPVLFGFVCWLLKEATRSGVKRLYFLARDGEVMLHVARRVSQLAGYNIDLKYLYVSRQALFAPVFLELSPAEVGWIAQKDPYLTVAIVAERLSLDLHVFRDLLVSVGFPAVDSSKQLTSAEIDKLKSILVTDRSVRAYVGSVSSELLRDVIGYLRQEGLVASTDWAVVDSGWNGRLQHVIQLILEKSGWQGSTRGFYFGVFDKYNLKGEKQAFLFSGQKLAILIWCRPFTFIFEVLTSAEHGITRGYAENPSGYFVPVLAATDDATNSQKIKALRCGLDDFLTCLDYDNLEYDEPGFRQKVFHLLKRLYLRPSLAEASALGDMTYSHDQTEKKPLRFAPPMSFADLVCYVRNMLTLEKYENTFWLHGSRVRSDFLVRKIMSLVGVVYFIINAIYVYYLYLISRKFRIRGQ